MNAQNRTEQLRLIAEHLGEEPGYIQVVYRDARKCGVVTKAKRGSGSLAMSDEECRHFLAHLVMGKASGRATGIRAMAWERNVILLSDIHEAEDTGITASTMPGSHPITSSAHLPPEDVRRCLATCSDSN